MSSVGEVPEKTSAPPRATDGSSRVGEERSPAESREASGDGRATEPEESFAAAVSISDPDARGSGGGPREDDVPAGTSEPPSAVDEALEATGDLLGS